MRKLQELLQDYFGDGLEISSYIRNGKGCVSNIKCNTQCQSGVDDFRSSYPEVFLEEGVLKICSKFTGEYSCQSAITIKLFCNVFNHWKIFETILTIESNERNQMTYLQS